MHGSLALARGVLYVGLHAKTAHVHAFDLGGRPLGPSFSFRDARAGRSAASGLAIDDSYALWVADTPADRVRVFTLFGREIGAVGSPSPGSSSPGDGSPPVLPGLVTRPVDVAVGGEAATGEWIAIACAGERRHAVQLFELTRVFRASCASLGEPQRAYRSVSRLAALGAWLFVAEGGTRAVQVFRDGQFHSAFRLQSRGGEAYEPCALAALADGRLIVGCRAPESGVFLVDRSGRVLNRLAGDGAGAGEVQEPNDMVVELGPDDRHARLFVLDQDALRLQAFNLEGRCQGEVLLASSWPTSTGPTSTRRQRGGGR